VRGHHRFHGDGREPLPLGFVAKLEQRRDGGAEEIALGDDADHAPVDHDGQMADAAEPHDVVGQIQRIAGVERDHLGSHKVAYFHAGQRSKFRAWRAARSRRSCVAGIGNPGRRRGGGAPMARDPALFFLLPGRVPAAEDSAVPGGEILSRHACAVRTVCPN
jgi:hypothetical protein